MAGTQFRLDDGLWQVSEPSGMQFHLYIFPKTYFLHLTSKPSKRPRPEDVESTPRPRKKVRPTKIALSIPGTQTPNAIERAGKIDSAEIFKSPDSMPMSGRNTTLTIRSISVSKRGAQRPPSDSYKLSSVGLPTYQSTSTRVFRGRHAQYGLVCIKFLVHHAGKSIQKLAQRWCREVSAARRANHPFLTKVLSADARLLSLCLDGQPILLYKKDDKNYFTGALDEGGQLCIQIASALVFLHSKIGKPHLAVNPGNIFKRGEIFSLSGFQMTEGRFDSNIPFDEMQWYAAPEHIFVEQAAPQEDSLEDAKKDVFSLAIILAYAWRRIPLPDTFSGPMRLPRAQWLRKIENIRQTNIGRNADPAINILLKALDPKPKTRCSSQKLLELAIDGFEDSAEDILKASVAGAMTGAVG